MLEGKKSSTVAERCAVMMKKLDIEKNNRAIKAADTLWHLYVSNKGILPAEVITICQDYLLGYWDNDIKIVIRPKKTRKKKAA